MISYVKTCLYSIQQLYTPYLSIYIYIYIYIHTCSILFNRESTMCSGDQLKGYHRNLCKLKLYWRWLWPREIWLCKKVMENRESFRHSRGDWPDQTIEANLALSPGCFRLRYIELVISVLSGKNAILLRSPGRKFLPTRLARHAVRKPTCYRTSFSAVFRSVLTKRLFVYRFHYVTSRIFLLS